MVHAACQASKPPPAKPHDAHFALRNLALGPSDHRLNVQHRSARINGLQRLHQLLARGSDLVLVAMVLSCTTSAEQRWCNHQIASGRMRIGQNPDALAQPGHGVVVCARLIAIGSSCIHLMQEDQGASWRAGWMGHKCTKSVLVLRSELGVLAHGVCHG